MVGVRIVQRRRARVSHASLLAVALTVILAAGATAAYSLAGRRLPASANPPSLPATVSLAAGVVPAAVTFGETVQLTGIARDPAGAPLAGRPVEVRVARLDTGKVSVAGTRRTDVRGRVTVTFRPAAGSSVWLRFGGAEGLAAAESRAVRVSVAPRVSVRASSRRAGTGWTTTVRGAVAPGEAGERVRLERRVGSAWRAVTAGTLARGGTYAFRVRNHVAGTYRYRVVRPAEAALTAAVGTYDLRLVTPKRPPVSGTGGPARLLVTGDSFAHYLGQQLDAARRPRVTAVESRPSTGLARPDFFDWAARARAQLAELKPGGVVVFLGANDCQPIRVAGTGRWVTVGTSAWVGEYRRRAAELMRLYTGKAERLVHWVGLPIAERPDIAACYRAMNAATAAAARDVRGVTWVDSWTLYAVHGRYSVRVGGVLARQEDGIHLTFPGTRLLTRKVYALLRP